MNIIFAITLVAFAAFPPSQSGVKFSHKNHVGERAIQCVNCHNMAESMTSKDKNIPGHDVCGECHSMENAPDDCRLCHTNAENPSGVTLSSQELLFSHKQHLKDKPDNRACLECHSGVDKTKGTLTDINFPTMTKCFTCHDGHAISSDCKLCHSRPAEMSQMVHPPDWQHGHKFDAGVNSKNCMPCHQSETFCSDCHAGENILGNVHDLNFRFNHGLEAKSKELECQSCHDFPTFCEPCHAQEGAIPLNHLTSQWNPRVDPGPHAEAARMDIESCASCHAENQATCAQPGCHRDSDSIKGTNPSIHDSSIKDIGHGPWHDDPNFECFQCHTNSRQAGVGFCGYCHEAQGN